MDFITPSCRPGLFSVLHYYIRRHAFGKQTVGSFSLSTLQRYGPKYGFRLRMFKEEEGRVFFVMSDG